MQVKELDKIQTAKFVAYNNSLAMNLYYVGSATECVISVAQTGCTSYAPAGTADTGFGTSGVYHLDATANDTFGEFCDLVEALDDYECTLKGAKRNDDIALMRDQTAASGTDDLKSAGGFSIKLDTAGTAASDPYEIRIGITPQSGRRVVLKKVVENSAGTNNVQIWGKLRKYEGVNDGVTRNDTTSIWSEGTANNTDKTLLSGDMDIIEFAKDEHVVIGAGNGGTDSQAAANDLEVYWSEK